MLLLTNQCYSLRTRPPDIACSRPRSASGSIRRRVGPGSIGPRSRVRCRAGKSRVSPQPWCARPASRTRPLPALTWPTGSSKWGRGPRERQVRILFVRLPFLFLTLLCFDYLLVKTFPYSVASKILLLLKVDLMRFNVQLTDWWVPIEVYIPSKLWGVDWGLLLRKTSRRLW